MSPISYLRLQARRLLADFQTIYQSDDGRFLYRPRYFAVEAIVSNFHLGYVTETSVAYAEHVVALMLGYPSWSALSFASETRQELARLRFENQRLYSLSAWPSYMAWFQESNGVRLDAEGEKALFLYMIRNAAETDNVGYFLQPATNQSE